MMFSGNLFEIIFTLLLLGAIKLSIILKQWIILSHSFFHAFLFTIFTVKSIDQLIDYLLHKINLLEAESNKILLCVQKTI